MSTKPPSHIKVNGCLYRLAASPKLDKPLSEYSDEELVRLEEQNEAHREMMAEMTPEEREEHFKRHPEDRPEQHITRKDIPPEEIIHAVRESLRDPRGLELMRTIFLGQGVTTKSLWDALVLLQRKNNEAFGPNDHKALVDRFLDEATYLHRNR